MTFFYQKKFNAKLLPRASSGFLWGIIMMFFDIFSRLSNSFIKLSFIVQIYQKIDLLYFIKKHIIICLKLYTYNHTNF